MRLLPADPPGRGGPLDVPGAVTATAGVALLVLAVARAGDTLQATQPTLLATRVVPAAPPHPHTPQPHHLFRHHAGGIP